MPVDSSSVFKYHWKAFYSGGVLSFIRLVTGFLRVKYIALTLGTAGIGLLSQASQLQVLGVVIVSLSISTGVINRMGAIGADRARERRLLSTAFTIHLALSAVLVAAAILLEPMLSRAVFGESAPADATISPAEILAIVFSVPLAALASSFINSVMFGAGRYDLSVRASIWATVTGFTITMLLIIRWGLSGAFWAIPASAAVLFLWHLLYVRRIRPLASLFQIGFDRAEAATLVRFSIVMMITGALVPLTRLWLQSLVVARFGIDAIGILHVPFAMSAYYAPFLTNGLWGRMYPAVASLRDAPPRHRELSAAIRLTVGLAAAGIVAMLFLQQLLVPLVFSPAFLPATRLMPTQLLGDYLYFVWFPIVLYALAISNLRAFLLAWAGYSAVVVVACMALMPSVGLVAVPAGYAIGNAVMAAGSLAWFVSRRMEGGVLTLAVITGGFVSVASQSALAWSGPYYFLEGAIVAVTTIVAAAALWNAHRPAVEARGDRPDVPDLPVF